ncbi:MAG: hypothetical protein HYU63_03490 [Armatimonadetes bacterium]|nr:hypothetical protein [Armatimonadota bacterium]
MRKFFSFFLILFFILFIYPLKGEEDYSLENSPSLNPKNQGIAAKVSFIINNREQIIYSNQEGYFYLEINQKIPSKIEAIINYKDKILKTYLYILEISENIPKFPKAKWCILTHLDGNSNLESYLKANLADLEKEGSEAKINLMALFLRKFPHKSADLLYLRGKEQVPAILREEFF